MPVCWKASVPFSLKILGTMTIGGRVWQSEYDSLGTKSCLKYKGGQVNAFENTEQPMKMSPRVKWRR